MTIKNLIPSQQLTTFIHQQPPKSQIPSTSNGKISNTIRSILDTNGDFYRKVNEKVLPSSSSTPSFSSSISSISASTKFTLPEQRGKLNVIYKTIPTPSTSIKQPPLQVAPKPLKATGMGPHEKFVHDLGFELASNYNKPLHQIESDTVKSFIFPCNYACQSCDFKAELNSVLDSHKAEPHSFKCLYCEETSPLFNSSEEYRKHLKNKHGRVCRLEKSFNRNACHICDFECSRHVKIGQLAEKLKDHFEIDCPFSKCQINASKKNLLQNLQAPSYFDCLNNAFMFNKKSIVDMMCADKYGDFKFSSFGKLDQERVNLLNNIKTVESLLSKKSKKKANSNSPNQPKEVDLTKEDESSDEAEMEGPTAPKKMKPTVTSKSYQIMCDLCQVMFVNENNYGRVLLQFRDHLFKFHMIRNTEQLDKQVEKAYLKLLDLDEVSLLKKTDGDLAEKPSPKSTDQINVICSEVTFFW